MEGNFGFKSRNSCAPDCPSPNRPTSNWPSLVRPRFGDPLANGYLEGIGKAFMAEAVDQASHEFWRPPAVEVSGGERSKTCEECGTEFIVGSRYCHRCGAHRNGLIATRSIEIPGLAELIALGARLGLRTPSLVAFLVGMFCLAGALVVGILFTARTALDWQAIQLWRIEWLLGAVASFTVGVLLKRSI
jgi:hypothetical protein